MALRHQSTFTLEELRRHGVRDLHADDFVKVKFTSPADLTAAATDAPDAGGCPGDARGGAALSVRQITGAPIKSAGVSEKIDGLEVFDAERHAGRVLGMGDILALVEQVTAGVDMEAAQKLAAKVKSGDGFDLNDFLAQLQQMKQMGGLSSLMDKLPAQLTAKAGQVDMDKAERDIRRKEGIIFSMTALERR